MKEKQRDMSPSIADKWKMHFDAHSCINLCISLWIDIQNGGQ